MKKIFIAFICVVMMVTMTLVAFAEDTTVDTNVVDTETFLVETEIATEGEITGTVETPTEPPVLMTEEIVEWIYDNYEEITVILAVIAAALLIVERLTKVIKTIVTCNNNAIVIAEDSKATTQVALEEVNSVKETVSAYKEEVAKLLSEVRQSDDEKKTLKTALARVEGFLQTSKLANTELANELAELLVLANIPNSKKEELYARHRAAVDAINAADKEVKKDVGEET